ncbi:MAG: hypothetical protein WCP55_16520 [Lentisphaerota bacterium]
MNEIDDLINDHETGAEYEDMAELGWPGDGSGMDDLADYNQNEAGDY